jgi:hypothetical protein
MRWLAFSFTDTQHSSLKTRHCESAALLGTGDAKSEFSVRLCFRHCLAVRVIFTAGMAARLATWVKLRTSPGLDS